MHDPFPTLRDHLLDPSGGLTYQLRALRYRRSLWAGFHAAVAGWLSDWQPDGSTLVIVGPNAGHALPPGFLERFEQVVALDLENPARMADFKEFCDRACQPQEGAATEFVYTCGAGENSFTVDPYGNMQMCQLSRRHSFSLKAGGEFSEGWNEFFPKLRSRKWQHNDACRTCNLMPLCGNCPGAAEMASDVSS